MLARLSAPLFLFCTVEGFAHTHDRRRYFLRIWAIGTAMGTVEFFMLYAGAFRRGDGFYPMNAIFSSSCCSVSSGRASTGCVSAGLCGAHWLLPCRFSGRFASWRY